LQGALKNNKGKITWLWDKIIIAMLSFLANHILIINEEIFLMGKHTLGVKCFCCKLHWWIDQSCKKHFLNLFASKDDLFSTLSSKSNGILLALLTTKKHQLQDAVAALSRTEDSQILQLVIDGRKTKNPNQRNVTEPFAKKLILCFHPKLNNQFRVEKQIHFDM